MFIFIHVSFLCYVSLTSTVCIDNRTAHKNLQKNTAYLLLNIHFCKIGPNSRKPFTLQMFYFWVALKIYTAHSFAMSAFFSFLWKIIFDCSLLFAATTFLYVYFFLKKKKQPQTNKQAHSNYFVTSFWNILNSDWLHRTSSGHVYHEYLS